MKTEASLKQLILAVSVCLLTSSFASSDVFAKSQVNKGETENKASVTECKQEIGNNTSGNNNQACRDIFITNKIYKSIEYKEIQQEINDLEKNLNTAKKRAQKYPDDTSFQNDFIHNGKKLDSRRKQLIQFKKEITKLYNDLQKIPNDSKRLNRAKELFNEGKFREASAFLEDEETIMRSEQEALLKQKDIIQKKLKNNAEEYFTLAKLTVIDYSLKDQRIPKTTAYFKQTLKSDRLPNRINLAKSFFEQSIKAYASTDNQLEYANFLYKNSFYKVSMETNTKILKHFRVLDKEDPKFHKYYIAYILNLQASLYLKSYSLRDKAEETYKEALNIYQELAKQSPQFYNPYVAIVSSNLGLYYSNSIGKKDLAEKHYNIALEIYDTLPSIPKNKSFIANTMNNKATLIAKEQERWSEARTYYEKALSIQRELMNKESHTSISDIATTLNNLALLMAKKREGRDKAERLLIESLKINRKLVKNYPHIYQNGLVTSLHNLANFLSDNAKFDSAEKKYLEALKNCDQLVENDPDVFYPKLADILNDYAELLATNTQRVDEAELLYKEALRIREQLATVNSNLQFPYSVTLNNLASLISHNIGREEEAEMLFKKALSIRSKLTTNEFPLFEIDTAESSIGLAKLLARIPRRNEEAKTLFLGALKVYEKFSKGGSGEFNLKIAENMLALAILLRKEKNKKYIVIKYFKKSLSLFTDLSKHNPVTYKLKLAYLLGVIGHSYLIWEEPKEAKIYLQKGLVILKKYAFTYPKLFNNKQILLTSLSSPIKMKKLKAFCNMAKEEIKYVQKQTIKIDLVRIKQEVCIK